MKTNYVNPFELLIEQNAQILEKLKKLENAVADNSEPPIPKYFNIADIQELTGWTKATIYGKTHRRELPVIKAGKRLLFPSKEFFEYMEQMGRPVINKSKQ